MCVGNVFKVFILLELLLINNIFSKEIKLLEETKFKAVSSIFLFKKQDSALYINYDSIKKLFIRRNYPEALNKAQILFKNSKLKNNSEIIFLSSYLIAEIFEKTKKTKKALYYYQIAKKIKDQGLKNENSDVFLSDVDYVKVLLRIGSTFHKLGQLDSARLYYKKLENSNSFNKDILKLKAISYSNVSGIFEADSSFDKAKYFAKKAISIHKKLNNKIDESASTINLGNIFLTESKYEKSKEIYFEALKLIDNNNGAVAVKYKASLYYNLAWAMRNLKDYKAYDFQELSYEIEDDLRETEFRGIIDQINAEYNFDVKKNLLLKEEENKRLKDQRSFWILGIISFIVIISLLYWLNFYKLRQKNLALQFSKNQLIQDKNIDKLKSESQVRILNATIDGKESERKEIAETLHDSVSALLSSANLHLQASRNQFKGKPPIEIDKTQDIITEASQKIRDLSHTLVSSVLLKFGLNFALKDMADKYSNSQINFDTDVKKIRRYNESFEVKVYNIMQELLNNILKHSKAENAMIKLREKKDTIFFTISDDGIGFDKTKIEVKDGLGINQIDARIQIMKGEFKIESSINEGTIVNVKLPIIERKEANLF